LYSEEVQLKFKHYLAIHSVLFWDSHSIATYNEIFSCWGYRLKAYTYAIRIALKRRWQDNLLS